ncbi:hypothetical protein PO909_024213 [Leuciscus waleckii]
MIIRESVFKVHLCSAGDLTTSNAPPKACWPTSYPTFGLNQPSKPLQSPLCSQGGESGGGGFVCVCVWRRLAEGTRSLHTHYNLKRLTMALFINGRKLRNDRS